MKTFIYISALALAGIMASCGGNQSTPGMEAKRDSLLAQSRNPRVERMRDYHYTGSVNGSWADSYTITRNAVDSLGLVTDDEGTRYVNNIVRLSLAYNDNTVFSHSFTKSDFASIGDSRFFRRAVLQGMAFSGVNGSDLRFVASVGLPDSDEFVQFAITVDRSGGYIIEPTEIMDETLVDDDSL